MYYPEKIVYLYSSLGGMKIAGSTLVHFFSLVSDYDELNCYGIFICLIKISPG
jgi:hypothetical protein